MAKFILTFALIFIFNIITYSTESEEDNKQSSGKVIKLKTIFFNDSEEILSEKQIITGQSQAHIDPKLMAMPYEILFHILSHCYIADLLVLKQINKYTCEIIHNDKTLWNHVFRNMHKLEAQQHWLSPNNHQEYLKNSMFLHLDIEYYKHNHKQFLKILNDGRVVLYKPGCKDNVKLWFPNHYKFTELERVSVFDTSKYFNRDSLRFTLESIRKQSSLNIKLLEIYNNKYFSVQNIRSKRPIFYSEVNDNYVTCVKNNNKWQIIRGFCQTKQRKIIKTSGINENFMIKAISFDGLLIIGQKKMINDKKVSYTPFYIKNDQYFDNVADKAFIIPYYYVPNTISADGNIIEFLQSYNLHLSIKYYDVNKKKFIHSYNDLYDSKEFCYKNNSKVLLGHSLTYNLCIKNIMFFDEVLKHNSGCSPTVIVINKRGWWPLLDFFNQTNNSSFKIFDEVRAEIFKKTIVTDFSISSSQQWLLLQGRYNFKDIMLRINLRGRHNFLQGNLVMNIILPHKQFFFIRHGQTDWNKERRTMGQKDIPLNDAGCAQAHNAARFLTNNHIKRIVHSPLIRAATTATILNNVLKLPMVSQDDLMECHWGEQEGCLREGHMTTEEWVAGKTVAGAESYINFRTRVLAAIARAINNDDLTLIVAHGGLFWALMDIMGCDHHRIDNCIPVSFNPPSSSKNTWQIYSLNPDYEIQQ